MVVSDGVSGILVKWYNDSVVVVIVVVVVASVDDDDYGDDHWIQ